MTTFDQRDDGGESLGHGVRSPSGAIVVAVGSPILWEPLAGHPVPAWSVAAFERAPSIGAVALVVSPERLEDARALAAAEGWRKARVVASDGARWRDALRAGLAALDPAPPLVVVHDGARPLITPALIAAGIAAAGRTGAAIAAEPVNETIKRVRGGVIVGTVPRERLVRAQTPQVFARDALLAALAAREPPDVAALALLAAGARVATFPGDPENLRVATPADLALAEALLARRTAGP